MDFHDFYTGQAFDAHTYLGTHVEAGGVTFRTYAPSAASVSVIGDMNDWRETPMSRTYDGNFWACTIANAAPGMRYKLRVYDKTGRFIDHCDPYGFFADLRPETSSIVYDRAAYRFRDDAWQARTDAARPLNIYEVHAGSWQKPDGAVHDSFYTYRELAARLIPYLKKNHYTHVELMPILEHPCDESWGYQCTGFFSATSRYGTPDGLKFLIDRCHAAGIGVILDFVPVHFSVNDYDLFRFDGTPLYEYPHPDAGYSEWGSCNFCHARGEVRSFLQSAAHYWLSEFHFDGLRMDAVRNLIYWQGDESRGVNESAISFLQTMNAGLKRRHPHALLIAEDSSVYPGVTKTVQEGGLGFDCKWDLGFMHDTLAFMAMSPAERRAHPERLTFSMFYFYNERYLLPFSHDEVVHGKASIVQKMHGDDIREKFAQARLLYLYMLAHPGGKLNFMGSELGMTREWDERRELDWMVLHHPLHAPFIRFMRRLNTLYAKHPALFARDHEPDGFAWLILPDQNRALCAFVRKCESEQALAVLNFGDAPVPGLTISLPGIASAKLILNTGARSWDGSGAPIVPRLRRDGTLRLNVPCQSGMLLALTQNV